MVQCRNIRFEDHPDGIPVDCIREATLEVRSYNEYFVPERKDYGFWNPICVDCFCEILHEGYNVGGNESDGWEMRWLIAN